MENTFSLVSLCQKCTLAHSTQGPDDVSIRFANGFAEAPATFRGPRGLKKNSANNRDDLGSGVKRRGLNEKKKRKYLRRLKKGVLKPAYVVVCALLFFFLFFFYSNTR